MSWYDPPILKVDDRAFTAERWNAYLAGNLTDIHDHTLITAGAHGLNPSMYPTARYQLDLGHIESWVSGQFQAGGYGHPWAGATMTFTHPFSVQPICAASRYVGTDQTGVDWVRIAGVTATGLEVLCSGYTDELCQVACIAISDQPDTPDALAQLLDWYPPRTWVDGEVFPYSDWNSYVHDDPIYLHYSHTTQTHGVHGMNTNTYMLGYREGGGGVTYGFDAQRYPPLPTQAGFGSETKDHWFSLPFINTASPGPIVLVGTECDSNDNNTQGWWAGDGVNVQANAGGGPHWYLNLISFGRLA
jgi:hypothetical protein